MNEQYLTIWDLVLTPIYLLILYAIARWIRNKNYPVGHPMRQYFLPGLLVKFFGAIFIALVYQYYYGFGDTYNYFTHSQIINSSFEKSPITWLKLLFRVSPDNDPAVYPYSSQMLWYESPSDYAVPVIASILGLLNGTTYMPITLLFALISYSGIWAMFRTFVQIYPNLHKQLAIAFLFIPSTVVWGSGLFKDTVCMFGLGWMTYTIFRIFINKDFSFKNILLLAFSFYLIAIIKVYILMAFMPALGLWLLMTYSKNIRYRSIRWALNLGFAAACISGVLLSSQIFAEELGSYSLEKVAQTAQTTQRYITNVSNLEGGSAYDLGEFDPTLLGMVSKFPQAVTVTLFRPFLWEVKKPIMLLSALESAIFAVFLVVIFLKIGIKRIFRLLMTDPNLLFFVLYAMIFAFAVGISTGNFGTLSRYKIPCMPFFAAFLVVIYSYSEVSFGLDRSSEENNLRKHPVLD
ncbi:hypothetical protein HRG84_19920 [Flavisolibacter sp. BT320]|nr:hypothetical protein [Flavisolibacter longurius]